MSVTSHYSLITIHFIFMIFWVLANDGFKTISSLKPLLCEFSREHADIRVEVSVKTRSSLWRQLFACLRQPREFPFPDLVQIPHNWTAVFSRLGLFQDLLDWDPGISPGECLEALRSHCLLPGTSRVYSLPWWMEVSALHYRPDCLREVSRSPAELLGTWEGFLAACEKLGKKRRGGDFYPLENTSSGGAASVKDAMPFVWNRGGELFSGDLGRSAMHKEEALEGIDDYFLLARKGYLPLMRERLYMENRLSEGGAAMALSRRRPRLTAGRRASAGRAIKTLPVPGISSPGRSLIAGHNLAVVRDAGKSREAFVLLKWLSKPQAQARYAGAIGALPCCGAAFENVPGFCEEERGIYFRMLPGAGTLPNITVCGTYEKLLDDVLWKASREILRQAYSSNFLAQKLIMVQAEMDYLLSLYGDR